MTVDRADVDPPAMAFDNTIGGRREIQRDRKRASQIVGGSGGNDPQWQAALDHRRGGRGDRPVAAANYDDVGGLMQPGDVAGDFGEALERLDRYR